MFTAHGPWLHLSISPSCISRSQSVRKIIEYSQVPDKCHVQILMHKSPNHSLLHSHHQQYSPLRSPIAITNLLPSSLNSSNFSSLYSYCQFTPFPCNILTTLDSPSVSTQCFIANWDYLYSFLWDKPHTVIKHTTLLLTYHSIVYICHSNHTNSKHISVNTASITLYWIKQQPSHLPYH